MSGYITLRRSLFDHVLWTAEPFTKGQAWVDILFVAAHKPGAITIRGNIVEYGRGQLVASEQYFAVRWKWSRGKVRRYFESLRKRQMIVQQKTRLCTLTTVINYECYQLSSTTDSTTDGPQTDTNNNYENETTKTTKGGSGKFKKPTLDQLTAFFIDQGSIALEAEKFFDHFESNGWKVSGRAPMKNWKSAARNWIRRSGIVTSPEDYLSPKKEAEIKNDVRDHLERLKRNETS